MVDEFHEYCLFCSQVRESTGALGGNGSTGAIYGELTMRSMQRIVNYMVEFCDLTYKSRLVSIFEILICQCSYYLLSLSDFCIILMNLHYASFRFIDIGAGLGKPNFHVAQDPCCRLSLGIELEDIRWQV